MKWINGEEEKSFCKMGCYLMHIALNNKIEVNEDNPNNRHAKISIAFDPCLYDYPKCHVCREIHFPVLEIEHYDCSTETLICKSCVKKIANMMDKQRLDI